MRAQSVAACGALGGAGWLVLFAVSAAAAPNLFSGSLTLQNNYALVARSASHSGNLSLMGSGGFALPAGIFSSETTAMCTLCNANLPGVYATFLLSANLAAQNGAGSFGPSYLSFGKSYVVTANATALPNLSSAPRSGIVRFVPGANGFGGVMPHHFTDLYVGINVGTTGYYAFSVQGNRVRGSALGATNPGAFTGTSTHTIRDSTFSILGASTGGPWITGTVTASNTTANFDTLLTAMGGDQRNAAGTSGNIALVTPQLLTSFIGQGGSLLRRRNVISSISMLTLRFLPEPGAALLLGAGIPVLLVLAWRRSRVRPGPR